MNPARVRSTCQRMMAGAIDTHRYDDVLAMLDLLPPVPGEDEERWLDRVYASGLVRLWPGYLDIITAELML